MTQEDTRNAAGAAQDGAQPGVDAPSEVANLPRSSTYAVDPEAYQVASTGRRAGAWMLDLLLAIALTSVVAAIFGAWQPVTRTVTSDDGTIWTAYTYYLDATWSYSLMLFFSAFTENGTSGANKFTLTAVALLLGLGDTLVEDARCHTGTTAPRLAGARRDRTEAVVVATGRGPMVRAIRLDLRRHRFDPDPIPLDRGPALDCRSSHQRDERLPQPGASRPLGAKYRRKRSQDTSSRLGLMPGRPCAISATRRATLRA